MKQSFFRLDEIRSEEAESPNYLEAITSIRGHFSSLEIAVEAMKRNASITAQKFGHFAVSATTL